MIHNIFNNKLTFLMTPERRFAELCQNLTVIVDENEYPNFTFWFKDDKCIFDYNKENRDFWVSYHLVWSVFELEFSLNHQQIRELIKSRVKKHFNLKDVTLRMVSALI